MCECPTCDESFDSTDDQRYCSPECYRQAVSFEGGSNPKYQGEKRVTECTICGNQFGYYPSNKPGLFCSTCVEEEQWQTAPELYGPDNPRWKGGKVAIECHSCGTTVRRYPSGINDHVFCSDECRGAWLSEAYTGVGHPNWKGGGNESYGAGWADVRERALARDAYRCVLCATSKTDLGRNPDVHHITPVRAFIDAAELAEEDAHALDNVITLCPACHRQADFGKIPAARLRLLARRHGQAAEHPSNARE